VAYHVCGGTSSQELHDNPQLDAFYETCFVFGDVRAVAGAEQRDFGLDVGKLFAGIFEVNLG
jgi:hypothetical protein